MDMSGSEFTIAIGPQHPALKEPASFLFTVNGEVVVDVEPRLGYNHRGVEKAMEARTYGQNLSLVERICGICSNVHQTNYCLSVEEVAGVQIPERAKWLRTLAHEMERIHSHLLWLGVGAHEIGFDTLFYYVWRDREIIMDLFEEISGNRVNYAWNVIGGVRRDISRDKIPEYKKKFQILRERTEHYKAAAAAENTVIQRSAGVGYLSKADMMRLCGVGPNARASGVDRDVRRDHPYLAFPDIPFKVITYPGGAVLANILVRVDECVEATKICEYVLDHLPEGETKTKFLPMQKVPEGECASMMEAQRGELIHYLVSRGENKPYRYKIRAPTNANIPSLAEKLKGQYIADIPIILAGIDPCFSCTDRMVFVDEDKNKTWDMDEEQLRKYGIEWYQKNGRNK
jgi:Ni,Fe-hydrogenase III large subunit